MKNLIKRLVGTSGYQIGRKHPLEDKASSIYRKYKNYTMVPRPIYMENLKLMYDYRHVEGCIIECGVWRGGMSAGMAEVFPNKKFYLFDSFAGLPEAEDIDGERALNWQKDKFGEYYYDNCRADIDEAKSILSETNAKFELIKGWFQDTLPKFELDEQIAFLRLDADWYKSTKICLEYLFEKVNFGGIIIFDDYHIYDGCRKAVHDFLSENKSTSRICQYNNQVAYIIK